ncbi:protein unc-80 homolog isoform X3 [Babylonia areolata]|uniref:protein unc-80 homolog isoform X3 n=1 Tax=Babylonia areolata TaxID=304850 RepID=UPI003FD445CD
MGKRKGRGTDDLEGDLSVPLPIQTFFWRQTSPFIRPRQSILTEASCVSFERVVVQNILHGLSPSLCEAIQSVSRWKVIQSACPHLMHACSSLITACKKDGSEKFGSSETKLLYTLHWIILDAASECEDADAEKFRIPPHERGADSAFYMHSLSTVQLFVYLFAPVIHLLKESDFESLKLENGLRLWQPLWDYQQPDIPCFASAVKPQRSILKAQRNLLKVNTNAANIYVGKGTSREDLAYLFGEPATAEEGNAPLARLSDICTISTSESNTAAMEVVCEHCNTIMPMRSGEGPLTCRCGRKDTLVAFLPDSKNYAYMKLTPGVDKDYVKQKLASAVASGTRGPGALDVLSASFLDIAVLRCLFCLSWQEDGIYWALRYVHKRMLEVCDELCHVERRERSRSHSLPIPDLQVLTVNGSKPPSPSVKSHGMASSPVFPDKSPYHSPYHDAHKPDRSSGGAGAGATTTATETRKEPPFKKIRVIELKQFFDSGKSFLKKRDWGDEGSGSQSSSNMKLESVHSYQRGTRDDSSSSCTVSTLDTDLDMMRPSSAMACYSSTHHDLDEKKMPAGGEQRKSMPVLFQQDHESMESSGQESTTSSQADVSVRTDPIQKPIIKITEHSPEPRPLGHRASSRSNYHLSSLHENGEEDGDQSASLPRSFTDSNIPYQAEKEMAEVPGSKFYIQDNGHINYMVVLQALHFVAMNSHVPRICEVLLNVLNCLLDLDIIETPDKGGGGDSRETSPSLAPSPGSPAGEKGREQSQGQRGGDGRKNDISAHSLAMDSLFRIYKSLGCPQGCGDGVTGPQGDHLRLKGQNCLHRLHKLNPALFHKFFRDTVRRRPLQETIDFLHAFLGFCLDPSIIAHSPQAPKKSASQETLPRNGYTNNFGHSVGGEGYRGVEGVLMANLTKPLITRCVSCTKELYSSDNIGLFCDVRQLMAYIKEVHGGTYRRVALSGLLDTLQKLRREAVQRERENKHKTSTPIRRTTSVTSESGDEKEPTPSPGLPSQDEHTLNSGGGGGGASGGGGGKTRRSIFRKRLTKSLMFQYAASDSEILEDSGPGSQGKLSPRTSISAAEDDPPSGTNTPRRRFSKFNLGWRRQTKSDHEDDQGDGGLDRRESKSDLQVHRTRTRMSFRTASHATLSFLSARKRIEDGIKTFGKKMIRRGSADDLQQQRSGRGQEAGSELLVLREKKLVDRFLIKSGMLRFSFLLECCHPGSFPDPQLLAAMLDLEAPVVARAAVLLECCHFIHRCNRGDWPSWMKHNLPSFRHNVNALQNRGQPSGYRRNLVMQRAAGRLFYSWAENLGLQLEYILAKEHADRLSVIDDIKDDNRRKELRTEDEEEDFLDEASINPRGTDCPYALKMLACLVLLEITTFLRETFQYLPRTRSQKRGDQGVWGDKPPASARRFSSIVSSPGHSDKSSESNIGELPSGMSGVGSPVDRKISFAVLTERSDSFHSSTTSLSAMDSTAPFSDDKKDVRSRRLAQGRQKLLRHFRRGSGHNLSFRHNRSFKLKRPEGGGGSIKQLGSSRSRKISSHSLQSDAKLVEEDGGATATFEDNESVTMLSDENQESPVERDQEVEDEHLCTSLPWIKVVVQLANLSNFICTHQGYCHPNCYERQRRSCSRLTAALRKMYESLESSATEDSRSGTSQKENMKDKLKRRDSIFMVTSPTKRRESTPLLEKIKTDVSMTKLKLSSTWKKEEKTREIKDDSPILKYLTSQAQRLTQCPMAILTKAAPVLQVENFVDMMPVAWELLLETDQELAAAAASVFLLSSVKSPDKARNTIIRELQHEETNQRINAILRFGVLWKFRFQVWPRMECDANMYFKLPPPSIDFTLPSPTIGLPKASLTVVDPPWMPHFKTKIEEVTVNQEETKSLVTATTTRRKQQQEMIRRALLAEEERKRVGRENFPMTTVPVPQLAAYEPALHSAVEEHEEAAQEEINLAARRVSLAPVNRANIQSRSMSWRNGSLHWGRVGNEAGEEERPEHSHHLQTAQGFFPSCICAAVLPILHLLDDYDVNTDGVSVSEVANKIIWDCIVDDPILFLRHFLEKLTNKERQEELTFLLRKLVIYFRQLPAQTAHSIFNYLVGFVMFYVRSPCEGFQEAIAGASSLLWLVVPCVEGIYFKDLKQTLKKEQCDPYLLVCANVASAKKILVHGPDLSSIPSQLPIHEDTQFSQILQESLEFFNIPEDQHHCHFIVDTKTHQVHNQNSYVRDFYFFRRNFYPQLSLVKMDPADASLALQRRVFMLKFIEIGKVLLTNAVLENANNNQNHVAFLHEEFLKLPSFPRKALETEFDMYGGEWGKELFGMDCLHKFAWTRLMTTMFNNMTSTFTWSSDLSLFMNVINGTLILLFEDTAILRFCLASLINICHHFKHVFATNGFLYIMPTLLRLYSNNQPNTVLCQALHFVCRQFYVLHRKPFVLQMFGSVAPLLDMTCGSGGSLDTSKVQPDNLFKLLLALEKDCPDNLGILELVHGDKPLKALDFCYAADPDTFDMMDVINMCVTVIAYAPDSFRTVQMLMVLEMVIPRYLEHLCRETMHRDSSSMARAEMSVITNIAAAIRALINCSDFFTRSMSVPQRFMDTPNIGKPLQNHSVHSLTVDDREDSHASHRMEEGRRRTYGAEPEEYELREEFRRPRDSILSIAAQFWTMCHARIRQLRKIIADPSFRPPELLDHKTHNRLAEIAHTLLKLIPYDPYTMGCTGLQRYMLEILPNTDWSQELVRPALNLILRRLDRLFTKISKKTALRRQMDWEAAANILKGVYQTLKKFAYIAYLPHLKTLVNVLISILLSGMGGVYMAGDPPLNTHGSHRSEHPNSPEVAPVFCSAVVKLVAMQMQALGESYTLEHTCGGASASHPSDRLLNLLTNFVLPLCIRVGCGCRDMPKLLLVDMQFVLTAVTSLLTPSSSTPANHNSSTKTHYIGSTEHCRSGSIPAMEKTSLRVGNELQHVAAFIGLEVLAVCFDKQLASEWHHVAKCIQQLALKGKVGLPMWRFLDFLVTHRPSLFLLLHTFIRFKMMRVNCDTAQEYYIQQTIKDKLQGYHYAYPKSTATILLTLSVELQQLRDQLQACTTVGYRSRAATFATDQTDFSQTQLLERQLTANLTEIAAEIIGPIRSSVTINTTRNSNSFSRSGSTTSAPPSQGAGGDKEEGDKPGGGGEVQGERASKRIIAHEGSIILDKFSRKPTVEDTSPTELETLGSPRLQRQPTICLRGRLSKQNSLDTERGAPAHVAFENEECEALNGRARVPVGPEGDPSLLDDPREHRLQRQDARSRKTFKIKRQKSKPAVRRFLSHRRRPDLVTDAERVTGGEASPSRTAVVFHDRVGFQLRRPGCASAVSRSVETIPESAEAKPAGRACFVPRSRSHDDPSADPIAMASSSVAGSAAESVPVPKPSHEERRSPSVSQPVSPASSSSVQLEAPSINFESPAHSLAPPPHPDSQVYVVRCDSSDSLSANESSALLRDEEKSNSMSSLCLYYADEDVPGGGKV